MAEKLRHARHVILVPPRLSCKEAAGRFIVRRAGGALAVLQDIDAVFGRELPQKLLQLFVLLVHKQPVRRFGEVQTVFGEGGRKNREVGLCGSGEDTGETAGMEKGNGSRKKGNGSRKKRAMLSGG